MIQFTRTTKQEIIVDPQLLEQFRMSRAMKVRGPASRSRSNRCSRTSNRFTSSATATTSVACRSTYRHST